MSLMQTLIQLSGVPGLETGVDLLGKTYESIKNISVYRDQCYDVSDKCAHLLLAARDLQGMGGAEAQAAIDEVEAVIEKVHRKVCGWASLSHFQCLIKQGDIKSGIESSYQEIDSTIRVFNFRMNVHLSNAQQNLRQYQDVYQDQLRTQLDRLEEQLTEGRQLPAAEARPLMQSMQEALQHTRARQLDDTHLQRGLYALHKATSLLPPMTELTGQIERTSEQPVAQGGFNDVYTGTWLGEEKVALKVSRAINNSENAQRKFRREVDIWRSLNHPNIVRLYGIVELSGKLYTVSPWMENGNSIEYLKRNPDADRMRILREVASGVDYLHTYSSNVIHGDLRGVNVLISASGRARISDFGLSKVLDDEAARNATSSSTSMSSTRWSAPERLDPESGQHLSSCASDVWSYAMLCLELLTDNVPYPNRKADVHVALDIIKGILPARPGEPAVSRGLNDNMWRIMTACWNMVPAERPMMSQVRNALRELQEGPIASLSIGSAPSTSTSRPSLESRIGRPLPPLPTSAGAVDFPQRVPAMYTLRRSSEPGIAHHPGTSLTAPPLTTSSSGRPSQVAPVPVAGLGNQRHRRRSPTDTSLASTSTDGNAAWIKGQYPARSRPSTSESVDHRPPLSPSAFRALSLTPQAAAASSPIPIPNKSRTRSSFDMASIHAGLISTSLSSGGLSTSPGSAYMSPVPADSSRSTFTVDSSDSSYSANLESAITDPESRTRFALNGDVDAGTLRGLIGMLLTDYSDGRYKRFKRVFVISYRAFITADDMLGYLLKEYNLADEGGTSSQSRYPVDRQIAVLKMMGEWLDQCYIERNSDFLNRVKDFAANVRGQGNRVLDDLKSQLTAVVDRRLMLLERPNSLTPKGSKKVVAEEPRDLAIALTILEGALYARILPGECVAYLQRRYDRDQLELDHRDKNWNNVDEHRRTCKKIAYWVKRSVLHRDEPDRRSLSLKYFINTALECRKLHNYSSMSAIVNALQSSQLKGLKVTWRELHKRDSANLQEMVKLLNEANGHGAYYAAINSARGRCVPCLDVHLKACKAFQQKPTKEWEGRQLINFARCYELADQVEEALKYKPPDLEAYRDKGWLAYLESALRGVRDDPKSVRDLEERSRMLTEKEDKLFKSRHFELAAAGFRV